MKTLRPLRWLLLASVLTCGLVTADEPLPEHDAIISKVDVDYIFSLKRREWETYAEHMAHPDGWRVRLSTHDTGTAVMAFDPHTGWGLSVQPLYRNEVDSPDMLIVGSYYPMGMLQSFTPELRERLEQEAQQDLGENYSVSVTHTELPPWEGIELRVTRR